MTKMLLITTAILLLISFWMGYLLGLNKREIPILKPVTRYFPYEKPNTVYKDRPVKEYIYKEVERVNLRVDTVYVPIEVKEYVIADRYPLSLNPKEITFRYFDSQTLRYQEDVYKVPTRKFKFDLTAGFDVDGINIITTADNVKLDFNVRAHLKFKKIGAYSSIHTNLYNENPGLRFGISYDILSK